MAQIDLSNYNTTLVQSTQGRAGTPDGNVYFDKANGRIEFISATELPTLDLTSVGGGANDPNPLLASDGIRFEAIYAFENKERSTDEDLRKYDRWTQGVFKFGGAYSYINSRKPATDADRSIVRGSGWNEIASDGGIDRIYFGNKGLSNIESTSQPYYQLSDSATPVLNDIAPVDYSKAGQIDEAVQVFGSTANTPSDAGAGNFDTRAYQSTKVRTFGFNYDEKNTIDDLGIAELGGYSTGFALNETPHLTTGGFTLADVYGGGQIAPFTGMSLEKLATPQVETGFSEPDGNFSWVLNNTLDGSLNECVAFLDALAQTDDDIDSGTETTTFGKRVSTWYYYDAQGRIVTRSGADNLGLFIEQVPVSDEQNVVFVDDAEGVKTRPFVVGLEANIGAVAKADLNAWFHSFFAAAYNTAGAVTVQDNTNTDIKGSASSANGNNRIIRSFDYDGDTLGGAAGTDKNCVFLCEGDGGATQAKTLFTITRQTTISFACIPSVENNAQ